MYIYLSWRPYFYDSLLPEEHALVVLADVENVHFVLLPDTLQVRVEIVLALANIVRQSFCIFDP